MTEMMGRRPRNSGMRPYFLRSSTVTCFMMSRSASWLTLTPLLKPTPLLLLRRLVMMSSKPGKAPPQMKRMLLVSTMALCENGPFMPPPRGTSTLVPSSSLSRPCCTASPPMSRLPELPSPMFFLAILSISSM